MNWKRTEITVNPMDPTRQITYTYNFWKLEIEIQNSWDVTSRGYWGSKQIWFTSPVINLLFNKYFEAVYRGFEEKEAKDQHDENSVEFCWHCGSIDLKSAEGYVGEEIVYCGECIEVLYAEDPIPYIQ